MHNKKIFIDTNILIDFFARRNNFFEPAKKLLTIGSLGEYQMWTGAPQITDIFYILTCSGTKHRLTKEQAQEEIVRLRKIVHISSLIEEDIDIALASTWNDFEDACVYQCANKIKVDAIISRNKKDFQKSSIKVFDCNEWFEYLKNTQGFDYDLFSLSI